MGSFADRAVENHKSFYSCSSSVMCAFGRYAGLTEDEAKRAAAPYAGGRQGKCGAVMAAEYILRNVWTDATEKTDEFEKRFIDAGKGSVMCGDLRGKVPGSCRACVRDASLILEGMLSERGKL